MNTGKNDKIKTVVFDLGKVLVNWEPVAFAKRKLDVDDQEAERITNICFNVSTWNEVDRGSVTREVYTEALSSRYPADADAIRTVIRDSDEMLTERPETAELIRKLSQAGYRLLFLSNTNKEALLYIRAHSEAFRMLEGGVASFEHLVLKPEPRIFEILLETYALKPQECLFIDDNPGNTEAASKLGFQVITLLPGMSIAEEAEKMLAVTD